MNNSRLCRNILSKGYHPRAFSYFLGLRSFSTQEKLQARQLTLEECKNNLDAHLFDPLSLGLPSDFLLTSFASMKG